MPRRPWSGSAAVPERAEVERYGRERLGVDGALAGVALDEGELSGLAAAQHPESRCGRCVVRRYFAAFPFFASAAWPR